MLDDDWLAYNSVCDSRYTGSLTQHPLCGEMCTPEISGFHWSSLDGAWERANGATAGGRPVYKRQYIDWGITAYLWHETDYDSDWVMGLDYKENSYFGWKDGGDLFDDNVWEYVGPSSEWIAHDHDVDVSCSRGSVSGSASIVISGDDSDDPGLAAIATNTIPHLSDDATHASSSPFPSVMVGAAIGAMVLMIAVIVVVLVKRSRKKAGPATPQQDGAHHVAEFSPTENVEPTITALPAEKECADEVHGDDTEAVEVVEAAAPK
jgi:hypothetical protein